MRCFKCSVDFRSSLPRSSVPSTSSPIDWVISSRSTSWTTILNPLAVLLVGRELLGRAVPIFGEPSSTCTLGLFRLCSGNPLPKLWLERKEAFRSCLLLTDWSGTDLAEYIGEWGSVCRVASVLLKESCKGDWIGDNNTRCLEAILTLGLVFKTSLIVSSNRSILIAGNSWCLGANNGSMNSSFEVTLPDSTSCWSRDGSLGGSTVTLLTSSLAILYIIEIHRCEWSKQTKLVWICQVAS